MKEVDNFLKQIREGIEPKYIRIYGKSVGDRFSEITNESPLYEDSKSVKVYGNVMFYRSKMEDGVSGMYFSIPFFKEKEMQIITEIISAYGEPYFRHIKMGNDLMYYPEHSLAIEIKGCRVENGVLVSIGKGGINLPKFTSRSLINNYVAFTLENPAIDILTRINESPKILMDYECKILEALSRAFLQGGGFESFLGGRFINTRNVHEYQWLVDKIKENIDLTRIRSGYGSKSKQININDIRVLFDELLNFYVAYKKYRRETSRPAKAYWGMRYREYLTSSVNDEIPKDKVERIENILCYIVDPEKRIYDLKQMIEQFNYPSVDVAWMKVNDY